MTPEQIIRRPIILTEKANLLREQHNQVVFEVAREANKIQIRDAVEKRLTFDSISPSAAEKEYTEAIRLQEELHRQQPGVPKALPLGSRSIRF